MPCILVGLKEDLRTDTETMKELAKMNRSPISVAEGEKLAQRISADCYMECSAKTQKGLKDVFDKAIKVALKNKKESQSKGTEHRGCCCIM